MIGNEPDAPRVTDRCDPTFRSSQAVCLAWPLAPRPRKRRRRRPRRRNRQPLRRRRLRPIARGLRRMVRPSDARASRSATSSQSRKAYCVRPPASIRKSAPRHRIPATSRRSRRLAARAAIRTFVRSDAAFSGAGIAISATDSASRTSEKRMCTRAASLHRNEPGTASLHNMG